ncbi:DNA replication and repair protein RecF [Spirosoma taeanense]|uniref:DNA replication and repair protein RecF n=1 Tax=Spirosoma taeanense TaxID=2735870 RepID=A0A6M5YFN8_9BACT|nr:DNA replication and repair protein RecF [Spirosoma taeanense]QJW92071.1 DNA replication and repair protein RecF [Spirosoma taeanense]
MHLEKLSLTNFKNYEDGRYAFGRQVNVIVGPNGSGKTNLLDAIYFLALSKSAFQNQDALSILHNADYFILDGIFEEQEQHHVQITISLQRGQRKVVMADKKPYERVSEHIGRFPVVLIAPNDTDLVREHSEDRRHFFDGVLSQLDAEYLRDYLMYQQVLKQRNSLLKLFAERNQVDNDMLDTYDVPLLEIGQRIHDRRKRFVTEFLPGFRAHYAYLSDEREAVDIVYESEVSDPEFVAEFRHFRRRDTVLQRTTMGVHKDDYSFRIGGRDADTTSSSSPGLFSSEPIPLKKFGSQGQQKTFVIALKLAQFDQLEARKNIKPILLLDDIFDKLDDRRIGKLIQRMDEGDFGQLFITDARPERTRELLKRVKADVRFFETGS